MKSPQAKHVRLLQEKHQENIETMLRNLFRDEMLSDITLHCKDGVVRAHRVILAASSSYFRKLFEEHPENQVAFLIHGVSAKQIKCLVELMYRGSTQIPTEMTSRICDIAEEFGVRGVVDENEKLLHSTGIDTRFKGQKRVTVDFENELEIKSSQAKFQRRLSTSSDKSSKKSPSVDNPMNPLESLGLISTHIKEEPQDQTSILPNAVLPNTGLGSLTPEMRRRQNWAMKQRKYKCALCPASFKRASHLSRHQLVHTGERPYACSHCDKAFSRHDKLKHHIRKAHDLPYLEDMNDKESENECYSIGQVKLNSSSFEGSAVITREDLLAEMRLQQTPSPLPSISEIPKVSSVSKDENTGPAVLPFKLNAMSLNQDKANVSTTSTIITQKKGRGRPRKYPPVPKPLIKRPRGRPRLKPSASLSRLPVKSDESKNNDSYTDINEYLTTSFQHDDGDSTGNESVRIQFEDANSNIDPTHFMEPLMAVKVDQNQSINYPISKASKTPEEVQNRNNEDSPQSTAGSFLRNIGLLETNLVSKMNIGECTISVSSSSAVPSSNTTLEEDT